MNLVIDFFFQILVTVWNIIYSNWILFISFLIAVIGTVINLFNQARSDSK